MIHKTFYLSMLKLALYIIRLTLVLLFLTQPFGRSILNLSGLVGKPKRSCFDWLGVVIGGHLELVGNSFAHVDNKKQTRTDN